MSRYSALLLVLALLQLPAYGKKKKNNFPALILHAQYVAVIDDPDQGVPLTDLARGSAARSDVETAVENWGRYKLTSDPYHADLIFVLHRGHRGASPGIGVPENAPPVMIGRPGDVNVGIGAGRPPLSGTSPTTVGPRMEVGSGDDIFSVYDGRGNQPLDSPPLWRYAAKNALEHPSVPAVDKLRKAVDDAEKAKP
jgi:hypothetical protein